CGDGRLPVQRPGAVHFRPEHPRMRRSRNAMSLEAGVYPQKLSYSQIEQALAHAALSDLPGMRIVVLRNVMVDAIVPYLRHLAYRMGYAAEVALGGYDNVVQE